MKPKTIVSEAKEQIGMRMKMIYKIQDDHRVITDTWNLRLLHLLVVEIMEQSNLRKEIGYIIRGDIIHEDFSI